MVVVIMIMMVVIMPVVIVMMVTVLLRVEEMRIGIERPLKVESAAVEDLAEIDAGALRPVDAG